jgi:hypothetical protein
MVSDGVVDLVESGAITNDRKTLLPDTMVVTFVMGTRRLYEFVDDNPGNRSPATARQVTDETIAMAEADKAAEAMRKHAEAEAKTDHRALRWRRCRDQDRRSRGLLSVQGTACSTSAK